MFELCIIIRFLLRVGSRIKHRNYQQIIIRHIIHYFNFSYL